MSLKNTDNIGLALSGGAARGIAHIGVLRALEEHEIPIKLISGTSVGAIIAALYAFDIELDEIGRFAKSLNLSKVSSFKLSKYGLFDNHNLKDLLCEYIDDSRIEDSKLPLAIIATDISSGEKVILKSGSVCDAVCASSAIPGLFAPVIIDNQSLVDGGLVQNLPVSVLKEMGADYLIGSDLSGSYKSTKVENIVDIIRNSFGIMVYYKDYGQIESCDLLITMDLSDYSFRDNSEKFDKLVNIGYQKTIDALKAAQSKSENIIIKILNIFR